MAVSQNLTLTQTSQSTTSNTSTVRIRWTSTQTGDSWNGYTKTAYYYVSINGGGETRYSVNYTLPKGTTQVIVDDYITVSHTSSGSGSISVRTYMETGISAGTVQLNKSLTLDTIARATSPRVSDTSVDMGESITISLPRASSSFTHNLAYSFNGGSYTTITSSAGTSYTWTVPNLATSIPKATSGTVKIRCITKSGGSTVGTKYVSFTANVPSTVKPTVGTVTVKEATAGIADQFGAFIQNQSKLTVTIAASGASGSTISAYSATFNGKSYSSKTFTTPVIATSGTLPLKVRVKDSRGRWSAYKTVNVVVWAAPPPHIQAFSVYRCNAQGVANDEGVFIAVRYKYTVVNLDGGNTAKMTVEYKRSTEDTYTTLLTGTALTADTTAKPTTPVFTTDYQYDVRITVTDAFDQTVTADAVLPSGKVILDLAANGLGIAFGKTAEQDGIDFGWDIVGRMKSIGALQGRVKLENGLLIQWGTVSITPSAADTPTEVTVTYPVQFSKTPGVYCSFVSSVPQSVSLAVLRAGVDDLTQAIKLCMTRSGLTTTGCQWLAIGEG